MACLQPYIGCVCLEGPAAHEGMSRNRRRKIGGTREGDRLGGGGKNKHMFF